jgi:hypothetical protein
MKIPKPKIASYKTKSPPILNTLRFCTLNFTKWLASPTQKMLTKNNFDKYEKHIIIPELIVTLSLA